MSKYSYSDFIKRFLFETTKESGYAGQGHGSGAESFYGSYYGFGGTQQLAGKRLNPATQKINNMEQAELKQNIEDQQKINGGYPSKQVYAGGDGGGGGNNGNKIPSTVPVQAKTFDELEEEEKAALDEQAAVSGHGRSGASDGSYRNLPGYPRHNSIEKQINYVPRDETDIDGDGEEDVFLGNDEYIADVLRLNGLSMKAGSLKKLFGDEGLTEAKKKTAVIIKGNPKFISGNKAAHSFYQEIKKFLENNDFIVSFDPGMPNTSPRNADLWVGHSRGVDRLRFAPDHTRTVALGVDGGSYHPKDNSIGIDVSNNSDFNPNKFHFTLTEKMKNLLIEHKRFIVTEKTLYHGTSNDHLDSIKKYGLSGDLGDFVKDSYGINLDGDDWEDRLGDITFAADKNSISSAVGAMRYHVGKKLDKYLSDVDESDLRKHGMLVVIRDVEESEPIKYPEDIDGAGWLQRPDRSGRNVDFDVAYPMSVEPGDWFTKGGAGIDDILTGNKMVQFLRRMGGLEDLDKDKRRELIKLAVAYHGQHRKKSIVTIVRDIKDYKLYNELLKYRKLAAGALAKQKHERSGGPGQKHKGRQLAFDFGESKYSLKNIILETGFPEPDRGTERWKQGERNEFPQGDDFLIKPMHMSDGHTKLKAAENSPGAQTYGAVAFPKAFVPEDWEQRHPRTKADDNDKTMIESQIKKLIKWIVSEELKPFKTKNAMYTGVHDNTGHGDAEGGSAAFSKNRDEVIKQDKKSIKDEQND